MGEASRGRSATTPTFSRLRSRRTRIERQYEHVVWTAPDQRNATGAPQYGQLADGWLIGEIGALDAAHTNRARGKLALQARFEIPVGARPAAEDVEAKRMILGKGVAGKMRFREQPQAGNASGAGEAVPVGVADGMEREGLSEKVKEPAEFGEIGERGGITAVRFDDPFAAGQNGRLLPGVPGSCRGCDGHGIIAARLRIRGRIWRLAGWAFRSSYRIWWQEHPQLRGRLACHRVRASWRSSCFAPS